MPNGDLHTHDNFLYSQMGKGSRVALQIIQSGIIENRMDRFIFLDLGIKIAATWLNGRLSYEKVHWWTGS